jgi:hypothetical protein
MPANSEALKARFPVRSRVWIDRSSFGIVTWTDGDKAQVNVQADKSYRVVACTRLTKA